MSGKSSGRLYQSCAPGHETISEEHNVVTAAGVGTQDANCEAPERMSPSSWSSHVTGHDKITEQNTVTQAPGAGTQDANCEAPERTSPSSWRIHASLASKISPVTNNCNRGDSFILEILFLS